MSSLSRIVSLPLPPTETPCESDHAEIVALFEERRSSLHRYLRSVGLSSHDGEEIVQEAFVHLCLHLRRGRDRRNLRGWLFRVAHHLALKRYRWNRVRRLVSGIDERLLDRHPDPGPTPEQRCLQTERDRRVLETVAKLAEQDRFCLHLRAEGLRYREIADVLGISLGSVANSLARSVAALSEAALR